MIIKTKRKKSSRLEANPNIKKHLSIQFSLDGFSFCINDKESKEFLAYSKYLFDYNINSPEKLLKAIQQIFLKDIELQYKFDSILALHDNELITFVPNAFFDKEHLNQYLKYNNKVLSTDFFMYESIKKQDIKAVFIPYMNVNNFLIDKFGSFDYNHASAILVEKLLNDYASKEVRIFVRLSQSFFKIVVTQNRNLLFFNTFDFNTKEDFMYYLLFTLEQLKMDKTSHTISFLGETDKNIELIEFAKTFFANITYLEPKEIITDTTIDKVDLLEAFELF